MFKTPYETTAKFLKEKGIVYDKLLVSKIEKKSSGIENALDNKQCIGNNIIRANDWIEIYNHIKLIEKENHLNCFFM